ncbi:MAG TPA: helix-turn-helix transcriptional regulator [Cyclobacteriaceae bacterium]|jgi:transcriptional regulator with XRE-family HTH domain|nr:helix-turn-helix transcriptional regulator [Cyclobacteriaceae bacterium]
MIGKIISRLRNERKWSIRELADRMHVKHPSISRWESGAKIPNKETIEKFAKVFSVPVSKFTSIPSLTNEELEALSSDVSKLTPADQIFVVGLVRRLKTNKK